MLDSVKSAETLKNIGQRLHAARLKQNLSLRQLAELAGVEHVQITKLEKGQLNASILTLLAITEALNIEMSSLFKP